MSVLHTIIQIAGLFCLFVMAAGLFVGVCWLLYSLFGNLYAIISIGFDFVKENIKNRDK